VLGSRGLEQYASFRRRAHRAFEATLDDATRPASSGRFHDGDNVSRQVLEWHQLLRETVRRTDHVTSRILDTVEHSMLAPDPDQRIDALGLHYRLVRILERSAVSDAAIFEGKEALQQLQQFVSYDSSSYGRAVSRSARPVELTRGAVSAIVPSAGRTDSLKTLEPLIRLSQSSTQPPTQSLTAGLTTSLTAWKPMPRHTGLSIQNIFDAHYLEKEKSKQIRKSIFLRFPRLRELRDDLLARYIASRDIVSIT
jgi:hypothetical protein